MKFNIEPNILDQALKLVRNKLKTDFSIKDFTVQADPVAMTNDNHAHVWYCIEPELKLTLTVAEDSNTLIEYTKIDYAIFTGDLQDGSRVDDVIGGDIMGYDPEARQVLRLAFILYNGVQYGMRNIQKREYLDKGWHPRVINVYRNATPKGQGKC